MDHKSISSEKIVGLTLSVNRDPGSRMLEETCECGFLGELENDGFEYERQAEMRVAKKESKSGPDYRVDLVINGKVMVELKGIPAE